MYDHTVIDVMTMIVLLLAAARLIRLVRVDKITEPIRARAVKANDEHPNWALRNLVYLLHCEWCVGFWASLAVVAPWTIWPGNKYLFAAYLTLAVAEVAPRIFAWEPRTTGGQ